MSQPPGPPGWTAPGQPSHQNGPSTPPPPGPAPGYGSPPGYGTPPGNAGQPGWQALPPEEIARMHRPGIIPLRPLTLSDIFGGALSTMRRNPEATLGMAVLVLGAVLAPSLLVSLGLQSLTALAPEDISVIGLLLPTLVSALATLVLSGFIIFVVSEAALGDRVGLGHTWRQVRGRLPALVGVTLLTGLVVTVVGLLPLLGVVLGAVIGGGVGITIVVLSVLAMIALFVWLGVRLMLSSAPVVLERVGPVRGMRRSWALTKGGQFWRLLGIYLLAAIVAQIFASAVSVPLQLVLVGGIGTMSDDPSLLVTVTVLVQHLAQFLTGVIVTPFTAGVTALLYLDQRIRREGLDLAMQQAAQQRTASRTTR